jgi:hypothetical protein
MLGRRTHRTSGRPVPASVCDGHCADYFKRNVLARIRDLLIERLAHQGVLVGVHWLGVSADHLLTGEEVHDVLRLSTSLRLTASHRYDGFLLESWERA